MAPIKSLVTACLIGAALVGPALAADLPLKAPSPAATPASAPSWTGFYLYGGGGYGIWTADTTTISPTTGACIQCLVETQGGKGYFGTVGAGYDYQFATHLGTWDPQLVAGVFADGTLSNLKGTIQDQTPVFAGTIKDDSAWAVGARIGWLATPQILSYFNAGFTRAHFDSAPMVVTGLAGGFPSGTNSGFSTPGFFKDGWFLGGGVETTLAPLLPPGWFLRSEYRYAYYGTSNLSDSCGGGCIAPVAPPNILTFRPTVQTVSTELIYKFNSTNTAGADSSALAYKARPAPMPAQNWTGFYLNGGGGYGMWTADTTTVAPTTGVCVLCVTQTQGGKGYFGTVGGGYDYQFAVNLGQWNPQLVAGLFADADFADIAGTIQDQTSGLGGKLRDTRNWAVGARIGWLTTPQLLSYFNGGFTQAHFDSATMDFSPSGATTPFVTPAFTQDGWFLGGGLETSLAPLLPNGWFLRSEYRYSYFGTARLTDSAPGLGSPVLIGPPPVFALNPQNSITFHPTIQTIATALVYKF